MKIPAGSFTKPHGHLMSSDLRPIHNASIKRGSGTVNIAVFAKIAGGAACVNTVHPHCQ
jgi:hypothetical protein